jgi:hypothetical protein
MLREVSVKKLLEGIGDGSILVLHSTVGRISKDMEDGA